MTKNEELLLITQEECAEVTQAISKVFRFGFDGEHNGVTNQERLTEEVGDLVCMIDLLISNGILNDMAVRDASLRKRLKLEKWSGIFSENPDSVN